MLGRRVGPSASFDCPIISAVLLGATCTATAIATDAHVVYETARNRFFPNRLDPVKCLRGYIYTTKRISLSQVLSMLKGIQPYGQSQEMYKKLTRGNLRLKWGMGSNLLKCSREQMGTKPAKVGRLAPGVLRCGAVPTPHRRAPPQKGLRSAARAKLLK